MRRKDNIYTFIYYNFYRSLLLYILININKTSRSVLLKLERNEHSHKNEKKNTEKHYHTQKKEKNKRKIMHSCIQFYGMNDIYNITFLFIICFTQNKHHEFVLFHVK